MSRRNVIVAGRYADDILQPRRVEFYRHIQAVTRRNNQTARGEESA
jgi:hypothetical protein